ncbi:MAG: hypothetical protein RMK52_03640 [Chitinophagales bacterium]|nr:hypothetical protein [Chitinophagales bacterium]
MNRIGWLAATCFVASQVAAQGVLVSPYDYGLEWLRRQEIAEGRVWDQVHVSQGVADRRHLAEAAQATQPADSVQRANRRFVLVDNYEWTDTAWARSRQPMLGYFYRYKPALFAHYSSDFFIQVNPVLSFDVGKETADSSLLFLNVRGVDVRGWVARKVGFFLQLTENQLFAPQYVREWTARYDALPYHGYYKEFKEQGVDFLDANGHISLTAAKFIGIQFGHGKQVLGNGFRSLALSDFSNDFLFLRLQTQVWKISYQNLFLDLTANFLRGADRLLEPKYGAVHHLSVNVTPFANVGVWESVVFHRNYGYELHYLNPVIFYRSIEQGLGSPDNTLLGMDYRVNPLRAVQWYGQVVIDDFNFQYSKGKNGYWGNKYGLQQGLRWVNALGIAGLDLQGEWNHIRPYMYSHADSLTTYTHYNAALAHPLGANVKEWVVQARYQPLAALRLSATWLLAQQGVDTSGSNWGSDIFFATTMFNVMQEFGNRTGQGVPYRLQILSLQASYMVKHNLFIDASLTWRQAWQTVPEHQDTTWIYRLGIRLNYSAGGWWF